jgi:hypothetical protein
MRLALYILICLLLTSAASQQGSFKISGQGTMTTNTGGPIVLVPATCSDIGVWCAASCAQTTPQGDGVQDMIVKAASGDTVLMPACPASANVTWTVPLGGWGAKNINLIGQGPGVTYINDNVPKAGCGPSPAGPTISVNNSGLTPPNTRGFRIANFTLNILNDPDVSCTRINVLTNSQSLRMDHIDFLGLGGPNSQCTMNTTTWVTSCAVQGQWDLPFTVDGAWGVIDHINVTPHGTGRLSQQSFKIVHRYGWGGQANTTSNYGDYSWYQPASWGTAQQMYLEDITDTAAAGAKLACEVPGGRCTLRHNHKVGGLALHGLDSGGRFRSTRQVEAYDNDFECDGDRFQNAVFTDPRGGTFIWFRNTLTRTGSTPTIASKCFVNIGAMDVFRVTDNFGPWGFCDGYGTWDHNEGITKASGVAGAGSTPDVLTVVPSPNWTPNEFVGYSITNLDNSGPCPWGRGQGGTVALDYSCSSPMPNNPTGPPASQIPGQRWGSFIISNTADTITSYNSRQQQNAANYYFQAVYNHNWTPGDRFTVQRAVNCLDGIGWGSGGLLQNQDINVQNSPITCAAPPVGSSGTCTTGNDVNQALDPAYSFLNQVDGQENNLFYVSPVGNPYVFANKNFYRGVQSPNVFDGTTGVGSGPLAQRPSTCTPGPPNPGGGYWPGVGWWATDQDTLYACTAPNTWTVHYKPYVYPHPLTQQPTLSFAGKLIATGDGHVAVVMPAVAELHRINRTKKK